MDDFDDLAAKIPQIISETIDKELLDDIGETVTTRVQKRTRSGKGVKESGGGTHKLPKLKARTVKERSRLKSKGQLTGPGATPGRSGVNRTGETLNDITYKSGSDSVEIKLSPEGARRANNLTDINSNYEFMNVSKSEEKALIKIIEEKIKRVISKLKL